MTWPYVESYFTKPLLHLQDVGTYILTATGLPADVTDELQRWSLVCDGQVQCILDDSVVLALASQRASITGFQLTEAGWRKLGWFGKSISQPAPREGVEAAPLIFVPKDQIGHLIPQLIGNQIGCSHNDETPTSAPESGQLTTEYHTATMTGITSESQDSRDTPQPPHAHTTRWWFVSTRARKDKQGDRDTRYRTSSTTILIRSE